MASAMQTGNGVARPYYFVADEDGASLFKYPHAPHHRREYPAR